MQLVLSNNRVLAHGENFISMGGTVINTETNNVYQNATVAECDGCPSDIGVVGYEYHAGRFVPCAPFGKGRGNIAVYCDDCKTPRDSSVHIELVCAMSSYMAFVGNVNADMVSAAFGKGNEDEIAGIGKALVMYSHFKGEDIDFSVLQNYDSLGAIGKSETAINEVLSSNAITSLMLSNEYSKPYVDLWKLNAALPKKYRKANYIDLVQDVEAMGYMYDNYATFEALNVLSSSLFIDMVKPYAVCTGNVGYSRTSDAVLYSKKCLIVDAKLNRDFSGISNETIKIGYRPNGTSLLGTIPGDSAFSDSTADINFGTGKFAQNITIPKIGGSGAADCGTAIAYVIPCE